MELVNVLKVIVYVLLLVWVIGYLKNWHKFHKAYKSLEVELSKLTNSNLRYFNECYIKGEDSFKVKLIPCNKEMSIVNITFNKHDDEVMIQERDKEIKIPMETFNTRSVKKVINKLMDASNRVTANWYM